MKTILDVLMSWAVLLSGYPQPPAIPEVVAIPGRQIEAQICGGKPCAAIAFLAPDADRIYLDDRVDLEHNTQAQGFVVHEMVHQLQRVAGKMSGSMSCQERMMLEREAYVVQAQFLMESGESSGPAASALQMLQFMCNGQGDKPRAE